MENKTVAYDLAKKYTFKKFDFEAGTPEELLKLFQETYSKIYCILERQTTDAINESVVQVL